MVYSIFLRPAGGPFAVERYRRWLELRPDTLPDPLGSGVYMVCGLPQFVELVRKERIGDPSRFPYCVLVTIEPKEINVVQEFGDEDQLLSAREFVKTVVDETGCEVEDEYGTSWTERVRREGVDILYAS